MPYLKPGRKKEVRSEHKRANTDGDFNYLFTVEYLEAFIANPCYATIAKIGKSARDPHKLSGVEALEEFLTVSGIPLADRIEAREEALAEFRRRIVAKYEDQSIIANGDLEEYIRAERAIQEKFAVVEAK